MREIKSTKSVEDRLDIIEKQIAVLAKAKPKKKPAEAVVFNYKMALKYLRQIARENTPSSRAGLTARMALKQLDELD